MKYFLNNFNFINKFNLQITSSIFIRLLGAFFGYLSTFVLVRHFGTDTLGIINLTINSLNFFGVLVGYGLSISVLRFSSQFNSEELQSNLKTLVYYIFKLIFPLSLFVSILLMVFNDFIALKILDNEIYQKTIPLMAIIIPFYSIHLVLIEFIRGIDKITVSEILRDSLRPFIFLIILLFLSHLGFKESFYAINVFLFLIFLIAVISIIYVLRFIYQFKNKDSNSFTINDLKTTSRPLWSVSILSYFEIFYLLFIIEIIETSTDVGIYGLSLRLALLTSFITKSIFTVLAPNISHLHWEKKHSKLQGLLKYVSKINIFISGIIFTIILIFSNEILSFFDTSLVSNSKILIILSLSQFINSLLGPAGIILNMTGNEKISNQIIIYSSVALLFLAPICIFYFGIIGGAILQLIISTIQRLLSMYYVNSKLNLSLF